MAWTVRSLGEISARVRGAFREYMPGTDASLANNFVTVTAKVLAALSHEMELRTAYLTRQLFLSTATGAWLERHCADIGIFRKQASRATGRVEGTGAADAAYPAGVRFTSGSSTYVSTEATSAASSGYVSFAVRAETAGEVSNRDAGGMMTLADPLLWPDLGTEWAVDVAGLGGGADIEDNDSLRRRGLHRKRNPPGAGALSDYERIALDVPGVVKAWAYRGTTPGFVAVLFLFEGRAGYIPTSSDVAIVQAAIDAARLVRVDDSVAVAPVERVVDVAISGLDSDTTQVRAAIEAALAAMLFEKAEPGVDGAPFWLSASWFSEAISTVTGEQRHVLVSPSGDLLLQGGEYPVLGTISYA